MTLPESTLARLAAVDPDLGRAIVRLTAGQEPQPRRPAADLWKFGRRAVITVRPTASLERYASVELVPLPDGRALISFDQPRTIGDLELTLGDYLDDPRLRPDDRVLFESIHTILRESRRAADVTLVRRNIIVLELTARRHDGQLSPETTRLGHRDENEAGGRPGRSRRATVRR